MRSLAITVALASLLVLPASPAAAQGQASAIQGHVVDESGSAIPGATVVVTHQGSGAYRQVVSGADGTYFVTGVVPGPYRITAELEGFKKYERPNVQLSIGNTATLDITLTVGGIEESVTVTGEAPIIDMTSQQIGANIAQAELEALPILNRNWMFAVGLTPGIQIQSSTASFSCESLIVGGGSNRSGNFSLDGSGNNDDYLGSSCGSQVRPPLEVVQEFQVLTNQYDAEFGRTAGSVINVVTKQGTNNFHGSLFYNYTDYRMTQQNFFAKQKNLDKPQTSQADWGGTLGGPIVQDKAQFFYSLDRIVYAEGRSNTFASRPDLNLSNTQTMLLYNHFIRFDNQINANNLWTYRYMVEYSPTYNRLAPKNSLPSTAAGVDQEFDIDRFTNGNWNLVLGDTKFNTLRVGYTHEANGFSQPDVIPVPDGKVHMADLPPSIAHLTFWGGPANNANMRINDGYEISDSFSWFVPGTKSGDHDLKFGGQFLITKIRLPDESSMNGYFQLNTDKDFNASDPFTYPERLTIRVPDIQDITMPTNVFVVFAQDKWRTDNVTLNLGVRYDLEMTNLENKFNPLFATPGSYAVDKNNISPRFGFAWRPGGSASTLIRGGYGILYDKITLQTTTPFVATGVYNSSFLTQFPINTADPGPRLGQLPTDPMLVNGPVVNRALLNALFPRGTLSRNNGDVFLDNPDRQVPYTHQLSVGYERQFGAQMALTVDYIHSWNRSQLITKNLNPGLRVNTSRTGKINYNDLYGIAQQLGLSNFAGRVLTRTNDGSSQFDGVNVSLEKRFSNSWAARVSYATGYARGISEANQTFFNEYQVGTELNLDRNFGPLDADRKHNLVINARYEIPGTHGLTVSGITRYMTGNSMNLINSGVDADQNGRLFDFLAAGQYCGVGENAICVDSIGGRNGAKGVPFKQTDLKFSYKLHPYKNTSVDLDLSVFNLFNVANFANPTADQRLPDFLRLTALTGGNGQPRALELNARLAF